MNYTLPKSLDGFHIFMVGIKGTGMAALAELLKGQNAIITGSDVPEIYFTDEILQNAGIPYYTEFKGEHITTDVDLVIHSSAYLIEDNPELIRAKELGIQSIIYTEALGLFSKNSFSVGIAGIHGKTTTTAITGTIVKELGLKASVLVGSGVPSFDNSPIYVNGNNFFIAETCEYQRHFLSFSPNIILVTSIEMDHPDYFKNMDDIFNAFLEYIALLPEWGEVIYCADDPGTIDLIIKAKNKYKNIVYTPYGETAIGDYRVTNVKNKPGESIFNLAGFTTDFILKVPGKHTLLDAAGSIAIISALLQENKENPSCKGPEIAKGLLAFKGTKRRSEIVGEVNGILFIDDYGHHPTAIDTTLKGYRDFYPGRRIVVDFMSHTYTRTAELLEEFSTSFSGADIVILNKIYSSAREGYSGNVTGETLYNKTLKYHNNVYYCPEYSDAVSKAKEILKSGDIFVTMGAGNNWQVGDILFKELSV